MNYLLKPEGENTRIGSIRVTLLVFGSFLNQSGSLFGMNVSITDVFFVLLILSLIFNSGLVVKPGFIIFFIVVATVGLFSATFYVPFLYPVIPSGFEIITNLMKFFVVFLYMVLGYNIARLKYDRLILTSFAYGGIAIGLIGILLTTTQVNLFHDLFYYESSRFKGLMNDPNYFAVIQVAVLACIVNNKMLRTPIRFILYALLIISILVSGSKTGFITLILYIIFKITGNMMKGKNKVSSMFVLLATALLLLVNSFSYVSVFVNKLSTSIPILFRISNLLSNPIEAASSGGSGRTEIWMASIKIIEKSPLVGVGFGTFTDIMHIYRGSGEVAHNTYIQIAAEWGILLSSMSIIYLFFLLVKTYTTRNDTLESQCAKDIVLVLLIGSLGISLNNSRLLWFFIGVLIFYSTSHVRNKLSRKDE